MNDQGRSEARTTPVCCIPAMFFLLGSGGAALAVEDPRAADSAQEAIEEIVVTGSRIKRTEFTSPQPVMVIDMEMATMAGRSDITDILQETTLASNAPQVDNSLGYNWGYSGRDVVVLGGNGTNTVDLRGLGIGRTLVLLNGRRLNPAGTRGTVSAVDLNTIPSSMIQRIEILKDGASSVYGSDAVSGVVNIITRKDADGISGSVSYGAPFDGGGEVTAADLTFGISKADYSFMFGVEYFDRQALKLGDQDWMRCPVVYERDLETGGLWLLIDPRTGQDKCFNTVAHDYIIHYQDYYATGQSTRSVWDSSISDWRVSDPAERAYDHPLADLKDVITPVRRISLHSFGNWRVNALGDATEAYFELQYNRRESDTNYGPTQRGIPIENHPFSPFYNEGGWAFDNALFIPFLGRSWEEVDWLRGVAGLQGDFVNGWSWDVNVGYGRSEGYYYNRNLLEDRVDDMRTIVAVGDGEIDCAVNLVPGATGDCVPIDPYDIFSNGLNSPDRFPQDILDYALYDERGSTDYTQTLATAYVSGGLFETRAGEVLAVIGAEGRRVAINDVPDPERQADNIFLRTGLNITEGSDTVWEAFAELEFPLLRGAALAEDLTLNLAGRYSSYDTSGSDMTYRAGLNWQMFDPLRLRAAFGTSMRAPALYENFLNGSASGVWFYNDPCLGFRDQPMIDPNIYQNCLSELGDADVLVNQMTILITDGNEGRLRPETSESLTAGLVFDFESVGLAVAIDYFEFTTEGEISRYGGGAIAYQCYGLSPAEFRQPGTICDYVSARRVGNFTIAEINDSYFNINGTHQEGVDLTVRYGVDIGPLEIVADVRASKILDFTRELFDGDVEDLNGAVGYADLNGQFDLRAMFGDWTIYYGLDYIAGQSSYELYGLDPVESYPIIATDSVTYHDMSLSYSFDDWSLNLGVQNIADTKPPKVSFYYAGRAGNSAVNSRYDLLGRRFSLKVSKGF